MAQQLQEVKAEHIDEFSKNWAAVYVERPGRCRCGFYYFYGLCGHVVREHPLRCGITRTPRGRSGFCRGYGGPKTVSGYYVAEYCNTCLGH